MSPKFTFTPPPGGGGPAALYAEVLADTSAAGSGGFDVTPLLSVPVNVLAASEDVLCQAVVNGGTSIVNKFVHLKMTVDGVTVFGGNQQSNVTNGLFKSSFQKKIALPAGLHIVEVFWGTEGGTSIFVNPISGPDYSGANLVVQGL
jgi:hypothetical protein